ncbi:hypothetical protein SAMN06295912_102181 [Sphingomonas laterariae]|uniref:Uncharacterized protein n=1 Tax=Edaphosphingomonas laterariae TaxID=861865 RepID=A0A239CGS5_9SPHN|nr:hypothetical protein [Sphingomonas laterariae]SNS18891.1 hypothetical protein SAMN06295912_102181 [Sphingomonas laterariae]
MQRVRIGLTGLAGVFVLVLVAAAVFGVVSREPKVSTDETGNVVIVDASNAALADAGPPKEPLAELGMAPGAATPDAAANEEAAGNLVAPAAPTEN